jgi:hypothetical protein
MRKNLSRKAQRLVDNLSISAATEMPELVKKPAELVANKDKIREAIRMGIKRRTLRVKSVLP